MPAAPEPKSDEWARDVSAGVAAGSRRALEALYEATFDELLRYVRERTRRDDAFALDCVHDAWLRVVDGLPPLPTRAALDGWLRRAALSAALDRLRRDQRRVARERSTLQPTTTGERADLRESLARELRALSPDDRDVLDLRFRRGLSLHALADALGVGMKAAEMRLRRALSRLRERVTGSGSERVDS